MTVASAVMVRGRLVRITLRLIGIAVDMYGAAAFDRKRSWSFLSVHGRSHHQR